MGLRKAGLGTVRQQRVVEGLEKRFEVLQSAIDRACCQVQSPQPPRGKLPLDRLMAKVFSEQHLDPYRRAKPPFGD